MPTAETVPDVSKIDPRLTPWIVHGDVWAYCLACNEMNRIPHREHLENAFRDAFTAIHKRCPEHEWGVKS